MTPMRPTWDTVALRARRLETVNRDMLDSPSDDLVSAVERELLRLGNDLAGLAFGADVSPSTASALLSIRDDVDGHLLAIDLMRSEGMAAAKTISLLRRAIKIVTIRLPAAHERLSSRV